MLVAVRLLPDVGGSGHVEGEQVLVVLEAVDLLAALDQVVEAKAEGVAHVVEQVLVVALKDGLARAAHLLHQLAQGLDLLKAGHSAHGAVDSQVAQPLDDPPLVELVADLAVDTEAEAVDEVLAEHLPRHHCVLEVLDLLKPALLLHLHLDFPHVQVLRLRALPLLHQSLQLLEAVFSQLRRSLPSPGSWRSRCPCREG